MHSPERINNDDAWLEDRTNSIPFIWVTERPDQDNYKILSSAVNGRNVSGRGKIPVGERHLLLSMQKREFWKRGKSSFYGERKTNLEFPATAWQSP